MPTSNAAAARDGGSSAPATCSAPSVARMGRYTFTTVHSASGAASGACVPQNAATCATPTTPASATSVATHRATLPRVAMPPLDVSHALPGVQDVLTRALTQALADTLTDALTQALTQALPQVLPQVLHNCARTQTWLPNLLSSSLTP